MFKNKTIKLFLILGVILFSLVGVVGCSGKEKSSIEQEPTTNHNIPKENESSDLNDNLEQKPGPSPIKNFSFTNFSSFNDCFSKIDMNNYFFVSFDLDNLTSVGTKKFFYGTNHPLDNFVIDFESYSHSFRYEFFSNDHPIGSGIDNTSFKIECYDILLINGCGEYDFNFELVNEKDTILIFDLLLKDECIMKIKIDLEENYTSEIVEDIILLLKNNIVMIRGRK